MDFYIKGFGAVDREHPPEFFDVYLKWEGRLIDGDITFTGEPVSEELLTKVENLFLRSKELDQKGWDIIESEAAKADGGIIALFAEKVLTPLPPQYHPRLIDEQDPTPRHIQFKGKMQLKGIGFEPEEEDMFVCFIYSVDWTLSHTTLTIYYNSEGEWQNMFVN